MNVIEDGLFKIVSSVNNINYFYYKQVLTDLIDSKLVGIYTKDEEPLIKITSEGKMHYLLQKKYYLVLIKLKADNLFKKELSTIEEESSVIA